MSEESEEAKSMGKLEAKLKLLKFTREKTGAIIDGSNIVAMERQHKALNAVKTARNPTL